MTPRQVSGRQGGRYEKFDSSVPQAASGFRPQYSDCGGAHRFMPHGHPVVSGLRGARQSGGYYFADGPAKAYDQ